MRLQRTQRLLDRFQWAWAFSKDLFFLHKFFWALFFFDHSNPIFQSQTKVVSMIPGPELCKTIEQTILTAPGSISNVLSVLEGVIDSLKTFLGNTFGLKHSRSVCLVYSLQLAPKQNPNRFTPNTKPLVWQTDLKSLWEALWLQFWNGYGCRAFTTRNSMISVKNRSAKPEN